jgi:curli biogenesis system outer membrane secretion channel CsgG
MEDALVCVRHLMPRDRDIRVGVNEITDGTGAMQTGDTLSRMVTQRPDLMLIVGLAKTGLRMVNRSTTSVAEWELRRAMEKQLGDGKKTKVGDTKISYRAVPAGKMLGSTHYINGAITEFNWNLDSSVSEVGGAGLTVGARSYYVSVAVDLLVTDTQSTEIVMVGSYSKQLVGREYSANLFRFFDVGVASPFGPTELFDFNLGNQKNEPVQVAVRWILETAAYDIASALGEMQGQCDQFLPPGTLGARGSHEAVMLSRPADAQSNGRNGNGLLNPVEPVAPKTGSVPAADTATPKPAVAQPLMDESPEPVAPETVPIESAPIESAPTPEPATIESIPLQSISPEEWRSIRRK